MKRAFFILQAEDLEHPEDFADYDLFVCNPDLPREQLLAFRNRLGELSYRLYKRTMLAYDNCIDAPSPTWTSDYWRDKAEILKRCHLGITWWKDSPGYLLNGPAAMALAGFHRHRTMVNGFDGIYLDLCRETWPPSRVSNVISGPLYSARYQYPFERQRYTAMLRRFIPHAILIGNSNSPIMDPMLDGCSLEDVGKNIQLVEALGIFTQQRQVSWGGTDAAKCVAWTRDGEDASAAERLAEACDWIYAGRIRKEA